MSLTIILSGPKTAESQARTMLASAGYTVHPQGHDYGLPETTGKKPRQAVSFLTVEADNIDAVAATVRPLRYMLRLHHHTPSPVEPSAEEKLLATLADMQREIAEIKAKIGEN